MARTITAAVTTESKKKSGAKVRALVHLGLDSGAVRVWSGRGSKVWDGNTYTGLGNLGKISVVQEGVDQRPFDVTLELSGVPAADLSDALNEDIQGRSCQIWQAFLDANEAIVANPVLAFQGRLDTMDVVLGKTATIQVRATNRLEDWFRRAVGRLTNADQQARFIGDLGLEMMAESVEREITWGKAT